MLNTFKRGAFRCPRCFSDNVQMYGLIRTESDYGVVSGSRIGGGGYPGPNVCLACGLSNWPTPNAVNMSASDVIGSGGCPIRYTPTKQGFAGTCPKCGAPIYGSNEISPTSGMPAAITYSCNCLQRSFQ